MKKTLISILVIMMLFGYAANEYYVSADDNQNVEDVQKVEDVQEVEDDLTTTENQETDSKQSIEDDAGKVQLTPQIKENTILETNKLQTPAPRAVDTTFTLAANDSAVLKYQVLSEDSATNTGTVAVIDLTTNPTTNELTIKGIVTNKGIDYTVVTMGANSLSGKNLTKLTLPNTLKTILESALSGNAFTKLVIPEGVTRVSDGALNACPNLKQVHFPSTLESLGSSIFGNADYTKGINIYLPTTKLVQFKQGNSTNWINNVPFFGLGNESFVFIVNKNMYDAYKANTTKLLQNASTSAVTYEMKMEFYDKDSKPINVDKEVYKLYNQPVCWEKGSDGIYTKKFVSLSNFGTITDMPSLPEESTLGYKANYWGVNELGIATVDTTGKIEVSNTMKGNCANMLAILHTMSPKMFAFEDKFALTEKITGEKTYDGESSVQLSFNRNVGDFLEKGDDFWFAIYLVDKNYATAGEYTKHNRSPGFASNTLNVNLTNVADSGDYVLQYTYTDTRITNQAIWTTPWFYDTTNRKTFSIKINPADMTINPQVETTQELTKNPKLPEITLKDGDSEGTIKWDDGQTPTEGKKVYNYTFTPTKAVGTKYVDRLTPPASASNFVGDAIEKKGSIEITYIRSDFNVVFKDHDDTILDTQIIKKGKGASAPADPVRKGYTFTGWSESFDNVQSDLEIKAQYKKNKYTVKFEDYDGSTIRTDEVEYEDLISPPSVTPRPGYTFQGWYWDKNGTVVWYFDTDKVTKDVTLYAKWGKEPVYDVGGDISGATEMPKGYLTRNGMQHELRITGSGTTYKYNVKGVTAGTYNLVVLSKVGDKPVTTTVLIQIIDKSIIQDVTLPSKEYNSILTVEGAETPRTEAGGLDEIVQNLGLKNPGAAKLEIELKVEKNANSTNHVDVLNSIQSDPDFMTNGVMMDVDLNFTKDDVFEEKISELSADKYGMDLITVVFHLPENLKGKKEYALYRYHGSNVDKITSTVNTDGEKIEVNSDKATITATIKKFSTYSIAYSDPCELTVENGKGSGIYADKTTVNIEADLPSENKEFAGWEIASGKGYFADSKSRTTTFTTDGGDAVVRAVYKDKDDNFVIDTGDTTNINLYLGLFVFAGCIIAFSLKKKKALNK